METANMRQTLSFDKGWKFHLGGLPEFQQASFDDSNWRSLNLPHDWSIEGPFDQNSPAGHGGGYLNGGIGCYRKTFTLPDSAQGQRISIQFDGAYMDSEVWINGKLLGVHPYGYTGFTYDLTPYVNFGDTKNVLAVRLNAEQPCSRWYSGAGLYRHVWLILTRPVHIGGWNTYVTTPNVTDASASIRIRTMICNETKADADNLAVNTIILNSDGKEIARDKQSLPIAACARRIADQTLTVTNPRRWSPDAPYLYKAVSEVIADGKVIDSYATPFGIRTFEFTVDNGFIFNGKRLAIKGVCNHHDLGCLGAAAFRRGIQRQLEILKTIGCNAIRTSHNPPSPELLDLCDQMGFIVMDEIFDEWKTPKTKFGYGRFFDAYSESDLVSMLQRDRSHPSIVCWSIGNEVSEQGECNGGVMSKRLADICRREDPTRPVTAACHIFENDKVLKTGYADPLDVFGINYNIAQYQRQKGKVLLGSETASTVSSRGEYNLVLNDGGQLEVKEMLNNLCTSYDTCIPPWATVAEVEFKTLKDAPWVAGEFVWTGFDYIGEPTPFKWPSRSSYFGIFDLCGFPKDRAYLYQSQWTDKPMVHILPHWNWQQFAGREIPVWAYTNCDSVELFLNGKSLGEKNWKDTTDLHLAWSVPFAPGTLKAVAKKNGRVAAEDVIHTAGKPAKLELSADRKQLDADGQDLSFITIRILDADGHICPTAGNMLSFEIKGAGVIAGLDNGDAINLESFQGTQHKAYNGMALAVIRSSEKPGGITLAVSSDGLKPASIELAVRPRQ
jgi:beta-galactosidase